MTAKNTGIVRIHNRDYKTVALRVSEFRDTYPSWTLSTEIVNMTPDFVVMKATVIDDTGRMIATGHAEEYRSASQINRTSALENAETSAIGRCLAAFGLGGSEFASANEVQNAIHQQETDPKLVKFRHYVNEGNGVMLFAWSLKDKEAYMKYHALFLNDAPKGEKGKWRNQVDGLVREAADVIATAADIIQNGADDEREEQLAELSPDEKQAVNILLER